MCTDKIKYKYEAFLCNILYFYCEIKGFSGTGAWTSIIGFCLYLYESNKNQLSSFQ